MPSFDAVSEVDNHELTNAVDQANRELATRFDFKGVKASFSLDKDNVTVKAPSDFQVQQMQPILEAKLVKRSIDVNCLVWKDIDSNVAEATQLVEVKQGIDTDSAKKIVKDIKAQKFKVQVAIQGDKIRVTGKKRDDLQAVMAYLREADLTLPVQFTNFRD